MSVPFVTSPREKVRNIKKNCLGSLILKFIRQLQLQVLVVFEKSKILIRQREIKLREERESKTDIDIIFFVLCYSSRLGEFPFVFPFVSALIAPPPLSVTASNFFFSYVFLLRGRSVNLTRKQIITKQFTNAPNYITWFQSFALLLSFLSMYLKLEQPTFAGWRLVSIYWQFMDYLPIVTLKSVIWVQF